MYRVTVNYMNNFRVRSYSIYDKYLSKMIAYISVIIAKVINTLIFLWSKTNRWHRGLLFFLLVELNIVPGGQMGFMCNDPALSYPYMGDTISWKSLLATVIALPLVVMLIVERKYNSDKIINPKEQALCWYKEFLFGLLINLTIIETLKLIVGSPRPHFFDSCRPEEAVTCVGSEYVSNYKCRKDHWLCQSDRSFPSGHTSLALYCAFFIVYYLHKRTECGHRSNVVLLVQVVTVVTAAYCCVSRVTDRRHHWWDVLAGAFLAVPLLFCTIKYPCGDFVCSNNLKKEATCDINNTKTNPLIEPKQNSI